MQPTQTPGVRLDGTSEGEVVALFTKLVWVVSLGLAIYLPFVVAGGESLLEALGSFLILLAGVPALWFLRHGKPKRAFTYYIWSIWSAVCLDSANQGGMSNVVLHANVLLILMGGWLLGKRQAILLWLGSVGWACILTMAVAQGFIRPLPVAAPPMYLISLIAVWTIGLFVMLLVFRAYEKQVSDIKSLNDALTEKVLQLEAQRTVVARSERKVAEIMAASPLPITVAHYERGVYLDVNPTWERTFQRKRADVLGKTSVDIGFWQSMEARAGWLRDFQRDGRVTNYEATFTLPDGQQRTFLLSSEQFEYDGQQCLVTMSVDVTVRKTLEDELKRLNAGLESRVEERTRELSEANRSMQETLFRLRSTQEELVQSEKLASLGRLVAGISHELNTPIGNALTTASTISDDCQDVIHAMNDGKLRKSELQFFFDRCSEGMTLINRSLRRSSDLIQSFKQVSTDQTSDRRRKFDLAQTVGEVMETLAPNLKKTKIRVEQDIATGIEIDGYPGPLGQILMNLVNNAVLHAYGDGEEGAVRLRASVSKNHNEVELLCEDDGAGIPDEFVGRVFDPFFTTKLGKGGSGLGLAISHRLTTRVLGGKMGVRSEPGQGTTFTIQLPLVAPVVASGNLSDIDMV